MKRVALYVQQQIFAELNAKRQQWHDKKSAKTLKNATEWALQDEGRLEALEQKLQESERATKTAPQDEERQREAVAQKLRAAHAIELARQVEEGTRSCGAKTTSS